jgi:hypothetical protein
MFRVFGKLLLIGVLLSLTLASHAQSPAAASSAPSNEALMARWREPRKNWSVVSAVLPNPVPEGQAKDNFFNENYERLAPTPAYTWFQYKMGLEVQAEKPLPTFKQTLEHPLYP